MWSFPYWAMDLNAPVILALRHKNNKETLYPRLFVQLYERGPLPHVGKSPVWFLCKDWSRHDLFDYDANNKNHDKE